MPAYVLWHNPRCSKSRGALELLQERGIAPVIRDYLGQPPDAAELQDVLIKLGLSARDLLRSGEDACTELGLEDAARPEGDLIAAMASHPQLIERPIFIAGARAVIGRPPERVLELL